jgi:hypothetical protein
MKWTWWLALLVAAPLALAGCPPNDDDVAGDDDDDDDASADDDTGDDDSCADYRAEYPGGSYGTTVGSVLADAPGMVDGDGNPHDFAEIYADRSKVALVIANAFDT